MTQEQLAEASGVSYSMVFKVEQGRRVPSDQVLSALADALRLTPERLLGHRRPDLTDSRVHEIIPRLRAALDTSDLPEDGPTRSLPALRAAVGTVTRLRVASQYSRLASDRDRSYVDNGGLPELLNELARAFHDCQGHEKCEAAALLTLAWRAADGIAFKYGYYDLSSHITRVMRSLAQISGDTLLDAAAAYVRAETFFATNTLDAGLKYLQDAIENISVGDSIHGKATRGSLHMRAAVIAGRMNDGGVAWRHLAEARRLAEDLPERIYNGTAFGPSSVHVHEVSVAIELDRPAKAIELSRQWSPSKELPQERRSHYYIDLAQAQLWVGLRDDAFESLQVARRLAPQHAREHPRVREALITLLRSYRSAPEALVSYAEWARAV